MKYFEQRLEMTHGTAELAVNGECVTLAILPEHGAGDLKFSFPDFEHFAACVRHLDERIRAERADLERDPIIIPAGSGGSTAEDLKALLRGTDPREPSPPPEPPADSQPPL
jgi:hypothetical protein